jgi:anti-sigma B factor antagonist
VRIEVRFHEEVAVIRLSGKFLAGSDGPFLRQKVSDLIEAGTRKLVIDFGDVPYIDSTGLGFLAGTRAAAEDAGITLALSSVNTHVRRVLDGVQLSQFFLIVENEGAAVEAVRKADSASAPPRPAARSSRAKKAPTGPEA